LHGGGAENGLLRDVISYTAKTLGVVKHSGIWHFHGPITTSLSAMGEREIGIELCLYDVENPEYFLVLSHWTDFHALSDTSMRG
jgi:hypothetical protein